MRSMVLTNDVLNATNFQVYFTHTALIQQYYDLKYGDNNSDADCLAKILRFGIFLAIIFIQNNNAGSVFNEKT
jgi:hypothetical protein